MADELPTRGTDDDPAAAELALGLIEGEERAAALRRVLAEPAFAAEVERWRLVFAQLFDLWPEAEPPAGLLDRIDRSIGAERRTSRVPWPLIATLSSSLAAALLLVIALRPSPEMLPAPEPSPTAASGPVEPEPQASVAPAPAPVPTSPAAPEPAPSNPVPPAPVPVPPVPVPPPVPSGPQPLLVAALGETDPVSAVFEPGTGRLRIAAPPRVRRGRVPQLWVIGGDGVPYSLGLVGPRGMIVILPDATRARLVAGATLAVSAEPPGGSPKPTPSGPVVATGALSAV